MVFFYTPGNYFLQSVNAVRYNENKKKKVKNRAMLRWMNTYCRTRASVQKHTASRGRGARHASRKWRKQESRACAGRGNALPSATPGEDNMAMFRPLHSANESSSTASEAKHVSPSLSSPARRSSAGKFTWDQHLRPLILTSTTADRAAFIEMQVEWLGWRMRSEIETHLSSPFFQATRGWKPLATGRGVFRRSKHTHHPALRSASSLHLCRLQRQR